MPQTTEVGYIIIKDGRMVVHTWKITDVLLVLIEKGGSKMNNVYV